MDIVGASPLAMAEAVRNFNQRFNDFMTAANNITSDTQTLQQDWQGQGYNEFSNAMGKWDKDIKAVIHDLQSMSRGVQQSSGAIVGTDANIARAFRSYQG
jgi:WXG100 family type VII secretion target